MAGHSDNVLALPEFGGDPPRALIVIAPYYGAISAAQLAAARGVLDAAAVPHETLEVPGSLEIAAAIAMAERAGRHDAYVALGCVIRGATSHYDVVVNESARALTMLGLAGAAVGNGIITVESMAQAEERADGARLDTAGGAAEAALHLVAIRRRLKGPARDVGFRAGEVHLAKGGESA